MVIELTYTTEDGNEHPVIYPEDVEEIVLIAKRIAKIDLNPLASCTSLRVIPQDADAILFLEPFYNRWRGGDVSVNNELKKSTINFVANGGGIMVAALNGNVDKCNEMFNWTGISWSRFTRSSSHYDFNTTFLTTGLEATLYQYISRDWFRLLDLNTNGTIHMDDRILSRNDGSRILFIGSHRWFTNPEFSLDVSDSRSQLSMRMILWILGLLDE